MKDASPSALNWWLALQVAAPILGALFVGVFFIAWGLSPIHWTLVRAMGPTRALLVQGALWGVLIWFWSRLSPTHGLVQGAICVAGGFYLLCGVLGWLAFALGVVCGFNGW